MLLVPGLSDACSERATVSPVVGGTPAVEVDIQGDLNTVSEVLNQQKNIARYNLIVRLRVGFVPLIQLSVFSRL